MPFTYPALQIVATGGMNMITALILAFVLGLTGVLILRTNRRTKLARRGFPESRRRSAGGLQTNRSLSQVLEVRNAPAWIKSGRYSLR